MPGSIGLHPCVDILIDTSHQHIINNLLLVRLQSAINATTAAAAAAAATLLNSLYVRTNPTCNVNNFITISNDKWMNKHRVNY